MQSIFSLNTVEFLREIGMRARPLALACSAASFLISYLVVLMVHLRYPIVYGIDGPYYLIQLRHILLEGAMRYPDPPLTYYLLLPFYFLSEDKNLGLKLAVAFYGGLTSLILYLSFRKMGDLSGLTAALTFIISPYTLRLANDFLKNYVSLLFIAVFIYVLIKERDERKVVIFSSLSAIAAALSHVLTYGVLALLSTLILAFSLIRSDRSKAMIYGAAAASITSFLLLAVALAVAPGIVGYDTNKLLSFLENPFGRSSLVFQTQVSFLPSILIGLAGILYGFLRRSRFSAVITASGLLLILINLPVIGGSWLFRFSLMSSILIPPIMAIIVGEVKSKAKPTAFLLLVGLMAMITIPTIRLLRPSISLEEYSELQEISNHVPLGSSILVPNIRLRYWVEALHEENYEILEKPPSPPERPHNLYIVIEKRPPLLRLPPRAEIIFDGRYLLIARLK